MNDVSENAAWLRAERTRRGMSAAQVAEAAMLAAVKANDVIQLTQQAVSGFENGRWKTVPRWMRYVRQALGEPAPSPITEVREPAVLGFAISMKVLLPSEAAMAEMFEALLLSIGEGHPRAEIALQLAQLLPVGLATLQGGVIDSPSAASPVRAAVPPVHATADRAPRSQPHI